MDRRMFTVVCASAALLLSGCGLNSETLRYLVTVEVDTPQGLRTGSSIWEVTTSGGLPFPGPEAAILNRSIRGEAVAIDLPDGTIYALMSDAAGDQDYPVYVLQRHLKGNPSRTIPSDRNDWRENLRQINRAQLVAKLDPQMYPLIVQFRDENDPLSVEQIAPEELGKKFSGSSIASVTLAVLGSSNVAAPVSKRSLEDRLPWLSEVNGGYLHGGHTSRGAPLGLHGGFFKKD